MAGNDYFIANFPGLPVKELQRYIKILAKLADLLLKHKVCINAHCIYI